MPLERPFYGRSDSLDALRAAIASPTNRGRGSYTVITGEPGIGKTTLVQEAVDGAPVVWGRATENTPVAGLSLWTQVLRATRRLGFEPRSDLVDRAAARTGAFGGSGQERY